MITQEKQAGLETHVPGLLVVTRNAIHQSSSLKAPVTGADGVNNGKMRKKSDLEAVP
jgi:hypothetical protein